MKTTFQVQYTIDSVGYAEIVSAASEDEAKASCEKRIKDAYPASACAVIQVDKVEKTKATKNDKEE